MLESRPPLKKYCYGWLHRRLLRRYRPQSAVNCSTLREQTTGSPPSTSQVSLNCIVVFLVKLFVQINSVATCLLGFSQTWPFERGGGGFERGMLRYLTPRGLRWWNWLHSLRPFGQAVICFWRRISIARSVDVVHAGSLVALGAKGSHGIFFVQIEVDSFSSQPR